MFKLVYDLIKCKKAAAGIEYSIIVSAAAVLIVAVVFSAGSMATIGFDTVSANLAKLAPCSGANSSNRLGRTC